MLMCYDLGYTNPICQVTQATKFCTVVPNICGGGYSIWKFLHVSLLAPKILT
jgi:hypothetical protein